MATQIFWEDVKEGTEITPLQKIATTQMLVRWAGAAGDFNPLHFENAYAEAQGLGKPIVHGQLKKAWLIQLMTDWIGEAGTLKKFSCQFRAVDYPRQMKNKTEPQEGETWLCKGKVTKKYIDGSDHKVDCEIWVENGKAEKTTPGAATAILPSKS